MQDEVDRVVRERRPLQRPDQFPLRAVDNADSPEQEVARQRNYGDEVAEHPGEVDVQPCRLRCPEADDVQQGELDD